MIYMDFFDLYYYTDRVLYKTVFHDWQDPSPVKRKNRLFAIADKDEYDFDTVDGNHLYSGFLDEYDEFKDQLLLKMERGKLDKIVWTEKRELLRGRNGILKKEFRHEKGGAFCTKTITENTDMKVENCVGL